MAMQPDVFVVDNAGKKIGDTAANLGECVGVPSVFGDWWGAPHVWGNAKDLYANAPDANYDKGSEWPAPIGANAVFDKSWGGGLGHVMLSVDGKGLMFQQNNPTGHACITTQYTAKPAGYIGWYRTKNFNHEESEMIATEADVKQAYWDILNRDAVDSEVKLRVGQEYYKLCSDLRSSSEYSDTQRYLRKFGYYQGLQRKVVDEADIDNAVKVALVPFYQQLSASDEAKAVANRYEASGATASDQFVPFEQQLFVKKG